MKTGKKDKKEFVEKINSYYKKNIYNKSINEWWELCKEDIIDCIIFYNKLYYKNLLLQSYNTKELYFRYTLQYSNSPFIVILYNYRKEKEVINKLKTKYIFIGLISTEVSKLLQELEKNRKLNEEDYILLNTYFKFNKDIRTYLGDLSEKNFNRIIFIPEYIIPEDTIQTINNKIFVYCNIKQEKQFLYINNNQNIGYNYLNKEGNILINNPFDEFITIKDKQILENFKTKDIKLLNYNNKTLNFYPLTNNIIHCISYNNLVTFMNDIKPKIVIKNYINSFLVKFYPLLIDKPEIFSKNIEEEDKKLQLQTKNILDISTYLQFYMNSNKINANNLIQYTKDSIILSLNLSNSNNINNSDIILPLLQIFNNIKLTNKLPFCSYYDIITKKRIYKIFNPLLNEMELLNKENIHDDINLAKNELNHLLQDNKEKGLILKYFLYNDKTEKNNIINRNYIKIIIYENSTIELQLNTESKYNIQKNDIDNVLEKINKIINKYNTILKTNIPLLINYNKSELETNTIIKSIKIHKILSIPDLGLYINPVEFKKYIEYFIPFIELDDL